MPSDPPAAPSRGRACPPRAGRAAPGGLLGITSALFCLALLLGGPGHPAQAAPAPGSLSPSSQTASSKTASSKTSGQPGRELLAAVPANMPPFYVSGSDGGPGGFAVEVLRRVATDAGYRLRLVPTATMREAELLLRQGKVQVVPGLGLSPAREQALGFTRPFETLPVHIFFRAAGPPMEDLESLAGKRLALVAGSIPAERLLGRVELDIRLTQTLAEAIFDVLAGEADALVDLAPVVWQAAQAAGVEAKLGRSGKPLFEVGRALAVGRGDTRLLAQLDAALDAFHHTPDFRELYRAWHPAPAPAQFSPVALWTMAALALGLTAALLGWRSVSLLRLNRRLTLAVSQRDLALTAQGLTEERLEALFTLAHMETASTRELVDFALEQGVRLTGSQTGYLYFVNGPDIDLSQFAWSTSTREGCALLASLAGTGPYPLARAGLWAECLRSLTPSILNDYPAHPGRSALPRGHNPVQRHMGVPLVEDGRALVMFGVGNKAGPYDETDARQLQLFLSGLWRVLKARRDADALRQAKDYAESLLEGANAMVVGLDRLGRVTVFNAAAEATTGHAQAEMLGQDWFTTMYPGARAQAFAATYAKVMAGQIELRRHDETPLLARDGRRRLISWQNSLLRQGEETAGVIAFGIDITERKQAEEDLRRLHRAIEQAAEGVLITDKDGAVSYANPAMERMTGLCGIAAWQRGLPLPEARQAAGQHRESQARRDEDGGVWRGSSTFARPGGQNVELEFTVSAIHGADDEVISFVTVCRDVTEKRLLERQLWQAQKMEALGTLAGGIAHDFNNILASIMGFTELALDDIPPASRAAGSLARVLKASTRAKELVRQILTFSRRADREQHTLHADQVIAEALRLMEASLPKDIEIAASLQAGDCAILADPSQTHQIVMNLCTNAAQAMQDSGRLSVRTRLESLAEDSPANTQRLPAGQYLSLTVEDTGPGIAPEVLGRIFDPFFTTKDSGQGTGLGLAVVHGIVLSLGGTVFAQSEPGQGARLTVLLPTAPACPAPGCEPGPDHPQGRGRILLVDDEADLLDLACQTLEPLGYQVAAHSQPEAALQAFLASPQAFDLLLTDQSMPRLTGLQLATRLRGVRTDLPIIVCTGYSMAIPPDRFQALGQAWLLSKPFSTGELARVVRQALTHSQGGAHGPEDTGR